MFSKDLAQKSTLIVSLDVEKEFVAMLDELLKSEEKKISPILTDRDLVAVAARVEQLKRLKNYRQYLEDALRHAS